MIKKKILNLLIPVLLIQCQFWLSADQKKFAFELTSNYMFSSPQDLNYLHETEQQYLNFYFDPIYDNKNEQGSIKSIQSLYAINTRLKYAITLSLNLSVGFSYVWKNLANSYQVEYVRDEGWRTISDVLDYQELATKISGYIPSIGIHYHFPISPKMNVECSLTGGPIFARVTFNKTVSQLITSLSEEANFPFYTSEKTLSMEGKGTGISLTGSIKLLYALSKSFGISFETGYSWQQVKQITGDGSETIDGYTTNYNGEWGMVQEDVQTSWGQAEFIFPTNNWDVFAQKNEDFILDLSGFTVAIGFYLKL